jgi:hypothetical protein
MPRSIIELGQHLLAQPAQAFTFQQSCISLSGEPLVSDRVEVLAIAPATGREVVFSSVEIYRVAGDYLAEE